MVIAVSAHSDMDPALVEKITHTFVAMDSQNPAGKGLPSSQEGVVGKNEADPGRR